MEYFTIRTLIASVGLCALAAGCLAVPSTPAPQTNTNTPAPTETSTTPMTGLLVSGTLSFAGVPLPGARAELRTPGWQTDGRPAAASAVADANGQYVIENPPSGDYSMIGVFPDGETDAAAYPPVTIAAGQVITGVDITLERALSLTEPSDGAVLNITPTVTLRWNGMSEAAKYRVWVIDAGTTELLVDQYAIETMLPVTTPLMPGRTYAWVVNAYTADDVSVGAATGQFAMQPSDDVMQTPAANTSSAITETLPPTCQTASSEISVYADPQGHYCFLYPARFKLGEPWAAGPFIYGPPLDKNLDAVRASMGMEAEVPTRDKDLKQIVDLYIEQFEELNVPAITRQAITLGGQPAELLEVVPGREGSRDIFTFFNGTLYHLIFMPSVRDFPIARDDVEALFRTVTGSFTFLQ